MPDFEWTKAKIDSETEALTSATQAAKDLQAHCNETGWNESIATAASDYYEGLQVLQTKLSNLRGLVEQQEAEESRPVITSAGLTLLREDVGRLVAAQEELTKRITTSHEEIAEIQRIKHEEVAISAEATYHASARLFRSLTDLTQGRTAAPEPEVEPSPVVEEPLSQSPSSETEEPPDEPGSSHKS